MTNILYGGRLSYFTGKARSYLHYKQLPFEERVSTVEIYQKIIIPRVGYPMIPVFVTEDDTLIQDTTDLMDALEASGHPQIKGPAVYPATPKQALAASLLELYGDEWLVIPAMHYRWAYNKDFALNEFGRLAMPDADPSEQRAMAEKTSAQFQGAVPLLGATPEMAPAIEASYIALLHELDTHFQTHDFLLGGKPCQGDFGLIGPLYAHLYRDPASGEVMKREGPHVAKWVERMIAEPFIADGDFLANDAIPDTLLPILKRQMREQGPCLLDLFEKLSVFKSENQDKDIPRAIGMHPFTVEDKTGMRIMLPYTQWMAQRAFEPLSDLSHADRQSVNEFLTSIDGTSFTQVHFDTPVTRDNHKLVWRP